MIKTTVQRLMTIKPLLQEIANIPMSVKNCITMLKLLKAVDKEYEIIEATQKKSLEKWAKKDEKGEMVVEKGNVVLEPEHVEDYNSDISQLLSTELTIEVDKVSWDVIKDLQLTPNHLLALEDFLNE